jgi:glycosyltransferase involved in cell wall biosynthesis
MKQLKVALVHDYLREYGGAERVLEALHHLYPEAPVFTAFVDQKAMGLHWQKFADWDIQTTWMAQIPLIKKLYSPLRVLAAKAFGDLDLSQFDVVISSSNAYQAKAVRVPSGKHICYCHTPPRSLYGYSTMTDWKKNPILRWGGALINHYMRVVDYQAAQSVGLFIANSVETQRRITKFYRRESRVVFPPVQVPTAKVVAEEQKKVIQDKKYFLYVNRLALAKHPELVVQVGTELGLPVQIVGSGPMLEQLKAMAGPTITFHGAVDDATLHQLYAGAEALLYPVEDEDFGIVPVEAMGHGVPVIAHRSGGPQETIIEGKTGVFFDQLSVEGLKDAINKYQQQQGKKAFDAVKINHHAQQYSETAFQQNIIAVVAKLLGS